MKIQDLSFYLFIIFVVASFVITATLVKDFYTQFNFYFVLFAIVFLFINKYFGDD